MTKLSKWIGFIGLTLAIQSFGQNSQLTSKTIFNFNKDGKLKESRYYEYGDRTQNYSLFQRYDKEGRIIARNFNGRKTNYYYTKNSIRVVSESHSTVTLFDDKGREVSVVSTHHENQNYSWFNTKKYFGSHNSYIQSHSDGGESVVHLDKNGNEIYSRHKGQMVRNM